jgi:type I site-specific restriction endonuclease
LHTNPSEYLIARETREAIIKEFKEILSYKNEFSSEIQELDSSDFNVLKSKEELKLKNKIPELKSEENLQTFRANFKKIGAEIGFTDKEIDNCVDSRMLEMAYYASIGKRASEKRNNAVHAQKRIASKPIKSVPNKFTNLSSQSKNNSAFAKLTKSGSIADALKIDF